MVAGLPMPWMSELGVAIYGMTFAWMAILLRTWFERCFWPPPPLQRCKDKQVQDQNEDVQHKRWPEAKEGDFKWWISVPESEEERELIAATLLLLGGECPDSFIELRLLRRLRAMAWGNVSRVTAEEVAAAHRSAYAWRQEKRLAGAQFCHVEDGPTWRSSHSLPHGEFISRFMQIGLRCGRARGGHPVKLERAGLHDTRGLAAQPGGTDKLLDFYYALLEDNQRTLDADSFEAGRLLRTYEVFDMRGLTWSQLNTTTLNFVRVLLSSFIGIFPETTVRAAVVNTPVMLRALMEVILAVLPARVQAKIIFLGEDFEDVLSKELDADAIRLLRADGTQLAMHTQVLRWLARSRTIERREDYGTHRPS